MLREKSVFERVLGVDLGFHHPMADRPAARPRDPAGRRGRAWVRQRPVRRPAMANSAKLPRIVRPCSVPTDSGWNCTHPPRPAPVPQGHHPPSSAYAVTSTSSGTGSATHQEW
jgi:hypothetical protein